MHELSLAHGLLDLVREQCTRAHGERVTDVHLVIGELANVVDDSLQFYWNFVTEDTLAAGSRLHFRRTPIRFACQDCGAAFGSGVDFRCTRCRSSSVRVVAGDECHVEAISLELEPDMPDGHERPRSSNAR
jgi:hydrogenase nickel incorporation protein HypA/HybF